MEDQLFIDIQSYLGDDYLPEQDGVLRILAKRAIDQFKARRRYPSTMSSDDIDSDLENHYSCIFDIALYSFIKQGIEFQSTHIESGVHRTYNSLSSIFDSYGILPFAKIV